MRMPQLPDAFYSPSPSFASSLTSSFTTTAASDPAADPISKPLQQPSEEDDLFAVASKPQIHSVSGANVGGMSEADGHSGEEQLAEWAGRVAATAMEKGKDVGKEVVEESEGLRGFLGGMWEDLMGGKKVAGT